MLSSYLLVAFILDEIAVKASECYDVLLRATSVLARYVPRREGAVGQWGRLTRYLEWEHRLYPGCIPIGHFDCQERYPAGGIDSLRMIFAVDPIKP